MAARSGPVAVLTCFEYSIKDNMYVQGDLVHVINFLLSRRFKLHNIHIITDLNPEMESDSLRTLFEYMIKSECFYRVSNLLDYTDTLMNVVTSKNVIFMYWSCHATRAGIICPNRNGKLQVCPAKTLTNIIMLAENDKILCIIDCCHAGSVIDERIFPPNVIKKDMIFVFSCTPEQNSGVMINLETSLFTYYCFRGIDSAGEVLFSDMNSVFSEISEHRRLEGKSEQTPMIRTTKNRNNFFSWF